MDWKTNERSLRRINLFVEGIGGQRSGTHKIKDEVSFVAVAGFGNGNGRIVTEDCNPIRKPVPIHVNESGTNETDCSLNIGDGDGDGERGSYAIGDCGEERFIGEDGGQLVDVFGGDDVAKS